MTRGRRSDAHLRCAAFPVAAALLAATACRVVETPGVAVPEKDPSGEWQMVLYEVVSEDGYVDYERLEAHADVLDRYVAWIGTGRMPPGNLQAYAHWLNAHTALALWLVLEEGRPNSVLDIGSAWGPWPSVAGPPFFHQRQFDVGHDVATLAEIVNERLRTRRQDIRMHAAITQLARSSPPMLPELYSYIRLQAQLDAQMEAWVADPERGVRIEEGVAVFNPLFDEYRRDFDIWTAGDDLCTTAARFAEEPLAGDLRRLAESGCPHRFFEFDWSLNHATVRVPAPRRRAPETPGTSPGDTGLP